MEVSKVNTKISEKISSPCMNNKMDCLFTRERMASKIKDIRKKYRNAVDSGKKSSGGGTVAAFYDVCNEIWVGCPATTSQE